MPTTDAPHPADADSPDTADPAEPNSPDTAHRSGEAASPPPPSRERVTFSALATATYCPRKLYYVRENGDRDLPPRVDASRDISRQYPALRLASDAALATFDLAVSPTTFRDNLERARERYDRWPALAAPPETDVVVTGRDTRGLVHKVLEDPAVPVLVSPGRPPEQGVWAPQGVRAVAAAKALAWRERTRVERTIVEYPRYGVVRDVRMTTRRRAAYRSILQTVREMDGPPARIHDDAKCGACEYREDCGVRTRSLRSLL